jgi:hypothetical protein
MPVPSGQNESSQQHSIAQKRHQAAYLLEQVMDDRMEPRLAINRWPVLEAGEEDLSLRIAQQALWHFESDEDRHQTEVFYLDAQLDLLKQIAFFLKQNKELPHYLIERYPLEHRPRFYKPQTFHGWLWEGVVNNVAKLFSLTRRVARRLGWKPYQD